MKKQATLTAQQKATVATLTASGWTFREVSDLGSVIMTKGFIEACVYWDGSKIEYPAGRA